MSRAGTSKRKLEKTVADKFANRKKALKLGAGAVLTALLCAACGGGSGSAADGGEADRPLVLGAVFALTGAQSQAPYINGVRFAVEEINAAGGINGKKIELKEYDDALNSQKSASAAQLAVSEGVDVVISGATAIQTNAAAPIYERAGVVQLNMASSTAVAKDESFGGERTFRVVTSMPEQIHAAAEYLIKEKKVKKVGLLGLNTDFGQNALPLYAEKFKAAGVEVLDTKLYPQDAKDLTNELLAVRGADAIVDWGFPNQFALATKTAYQNGMGDIPHLGPSAVGIVNTLNLVPVENRESLLGMSSCDPAADKREHVQEWAKKFKEKYNAVADSSAAVGYDAVKIAKAAVEAAGSVDREKIAEALKTLSLSEGTVCASKYQADERHELMHEAVVISYANGEPKEMARYTAEDLAGQGRKQG